MKTRFIKTEDNQELFFYSYTSDKKPKLVLQFAHGMGEHAGRYHDFFQYLLDRDIFVFANDHRGHGKTAERNGVLGHYDDHNGFEKAVKDLKMIHDDIYARYPDTPHVIMGHSMGSFLVRRFIEHYPDVKEAVILSATGYHQGLLGKVGQFLSLIETKLFGKTHRSKLLDRFSFGKYQRHFKNRGSWLSRDEEIVAAYREDPLSGYVATSQFYHDLLTGIETLHKEQELRKVNKDVPILLISGDEDPVGDFSKGVKRVVNDYKQIGVSTVDVIFYPEGRHEMLFEKNRAEVTVDVCRWLVSTLT
ncbi:lysophospholipase [Paraliobacillus sp. JSM ZJ581]|uniref:alpha/beta hydrolase n=1 Tax=Paraliobacillus sp. JSM ZJ581 TaxID=3342118 RepID=UPI0035A9AB47